MASLHEILLEVTGNATDARSTLAEVAAELSAFDGSDATATLEVRTAEVIAGIEKVKADLARLKDEDITVEVKIKRDLATAGLRALEDQIGEFQRGLVDGGIFGDDESEDAFAKRRRALTAQLSAWTAQIETFASSVNGQLGKFDDTAVVVDIDGLKAAEAELDVFKLRLREAGAQRVTPEVRLQIAKALADLELFKRRSEEVQRQASQNNGRATGVSGLFGSFATVSRDAEKALTAFGALGEEGGKAAGLLTQAFGSGGAGGAIATFAGKSRDVQEAVTSVGIVLVGALIPALFALAGAFAAAVVGAAGLGTAFVAALGPAVLLLVGLFNRFSKILAARKAQQAEDTAATNTGAQAAKQAAAAEEARYQAQARVRDALQGVTTAERTLADARRRAAEEIAGLADQDASAQRSVQAAVIDLGRADEDVSNARKKARQDIIDLAGKEADAARTLARARVDADRSNDAASSRLADAQRRVTEEHKKLAAAASGSGAAAVKAAEDARRAHEAYRQAVQAVTDAQFALADAILAVAGANLSVEEAQLRVNELLAKTPALATAAFAALARINDVDFGPDALSGLTQDIGTVGGPDASQSAFDLQRALLALAKAKLGVQQASLKQSEAEDNVTVKQGDAQRAQAAQNVTTQKATVDQTAYRDALRAVTEAQRGLRDSQIQGARSVADAGRAYRDAAKDARDARRAGVEGSDGVRTARRQEADAERKLGDAQRDAAKTARALAVARARGIEGNPQVISALEGVRDAYESLASAQHAAERAGQDQLDTIPAAASKANAALGELDASEQRFLGTITKVVGAFKGILQPATDAIFDALSDAVDLLVPYVGGLKGLFSGIAKVWAGSIRSGAKALIEPAWRNAIRDIFKGTAAISGPGLNGLGSILVLMRNLAVALLPSVVDIVTRVAGGLKRLAASTDDIGKLRRTFAPLIEAFLSISDLVGSLIGLFYDFGVAVGPIGTPLVDSITGVVNGLRDFLKSKQGLEIVKAFFADTLPLAKEVGKLIVALGIAFGGLFQIAAPILTPLVKAMTGVATAVGLALQAFRRLLDLDFRGFASLGTKALGALADALLDPKAIAKAAAFMGALAVAAGLLIPPFVAIGSGVMTAVRFGMSAGAAALALAFRAGMLAAQVAGAVLLPIFSALGSLIVGAVQLGIAIATPIAAAAMSALGAIMAAALTVGPFLLIGAAIIAAIVVAVKNWGPIKRAVTNGVNTVIAFLSGTVGRFARAAGQWISAIVTRLGQLGGQARATVARAISAVTSYLGARVGDFGRLAGRFVSAIVGGLRRGVGAITGAARGIFNGIVGAFRGIGAAIGRVITPVFNVLAGLLNNVIRAINFVIRGVNSIPNVKTPFGDIGIPNIRQLGLIRTLAVGGVARGSTIAQIGEAGDEAVLPLTRAVFDSLGDSIARSLASSRSSPVATPGRAPAPAVAAQGAAGGVEQHFHITAPAGRLPDAETTIALLSGKLRARGALIAR